MADQSWSIHAPPRITELTFVNALIEGPRVFRGEEEAARIYGTLVEHGVDPSFALGHFWVESLFGNAGWNIWSEPPMKSWGNILYVNSQIKDWEGVLEYEASNGYEYTIYPDWHTGIEDYVRLLADYRDRSPDSRYGDTSIIHGATAKWMAKVPDSDEHLNYLDIVLARMSRYDNAIPWEGDMAVFTPGVTYSTNARYAIKTGDRWYPKPGGSISYPFRADGSAVCLGQVMGGSWVAIRVMTSRYSTDQKTRPVIGYVPNFEASRFTLT